MNRIIFNLVIALTACLFLNSCTHKNVNSESGYFHNRVIPVESNAKTVTYLLCYEVGHRYSDCQGRCITVEGSTCHVNCMGFGNICVRATNVTLNQIGSTITATTVDTFDLTSEDFFLMPDRSLSYMDGDDNQMYLNIPAQLVFRDEDTQQFTFTGLSFSESPLYSNN